MTVTLLHLVFVCCAGLAAGLVNALAGGGTLVSFPILTAIGLPPVAANVTNTVALCPGFIGGILAQRNDLRGQSGRLWRLLPVGIVGGVIGGVLLLTTAERVFRALVPLLILMACGLLAAQNRIRVWLTRRGMHAGGHASHELLATIPVGLGAIYGGYFGAGLGVILLATLGLVIDDSLVRINALKQAIALAVNFAAAIYFLFSGEVVWTAALVMAAGSIVGGSIGGRLAQRVPTEVLRGAVITIGVSVAIVYLVKQ